MPTAAELLAELDTLVRNVEAQQAAESEGRPMLAREAGSARAASWGRLVGMIREVCGECNQEG